MARPRDWHDDGCRQKDQIETVVIAGRESAQHHRHVDHADIREDDPEDKEQLRSENRELLSERNKPDEKTRFEDRPDKEQLLQV